MFDFKKKILGPLIDNTVGKIDGALRMEGVTDRLETLLSVKEEADTSFSKIENREATQGIAAIVAVVVGDLALLLAAPGPVLFVAILTIAGIAGYSYKTVSNSNATAAAAKKLKSTIDTEVSNLAAAHPQEAVKSPRFQKGLKERFNLLSAGEPELTQLRALLAPACAIQPRATFGL